MPTLVQVLYGLLGLKLLDVARLIYKFFLRPGKNLRKFGEWAVVTGSTSGIGRAYSFELAKQGMNVMLVSRSEASLADLETELKSKYPKISVDHLAVDFSKLDEAARAAVKAKLDVLDVGVLINNVGLSYPFTKYFHELKDKEIADIMEVNVSSTTWMTRIVLGDVDGELPPNPTNGMLKRKRGAIVNTSSAGGRIVSPFLAEYSGAKSFVEMFSKALNAELAPKGIHVQSQTPLFVVSNMSKIKKSSITVPTPETYVKAAVKQIGYDNAVSPYWTHSLQLWVLSLLPESVGTMITMSMHQTIRKKGMKKEKTKLEESKKGQ